MDADINFLATASSIVTEFGPASCAGRTPQELPTRDINSVGQGRSSPNGPLETKSPGLKDLSQLDNPSNYNLRSMACWRYHPVEYASPITRILCRPGNRGNQKGDRKAHASSENVANQATHLPRPSPTHWIHGPIHALGLHGQSLVPSTESLAQPQVGLNDSRIRCISLAYLPFGSVPGVLDAAELLYNTEVDPSPPARPGWVQLFLMHPDARRSPGQEFNYQPP